MVNRGHVLTVGNDDGVMHPTNLGWASIEKPAGTSMVGSVGFSPPVNSLANRPKPNMPGPLLWWLCCGLQVIGHLPGPCSFDANSRPLRGGGSIPCCASPASPSLPCPAQSRARLLSPAVGQPHHRSRHCTSPKLRLPVTTWDLSSSWSQTTLTIPAIVSSTTLRQRLSRVICCTRFVRILLDPPLSASVFR
jgi:hypothetical protein